MSIQATGLTKIYGQQRAVNEIDVMLEATGITGFLGPNGAGKSTTMKMLTGYLHPDAGEALVCGYNVATHPLEVKRNIGYLPESNALYYEMYVREYLQFSAHLYKLQNKKQRIAQTIEQVGLGHEAHKKIGQLSKGYKQRVGLAAAILHQPRVLILDEPTSGLDPNQILEIRQLIKELGINRTVLLSTHIMQEVEALCERVIIINRGNIVANDLLTNLVGPAQQTVLQVTFAEPLEAQWLQRLDEQAVITRTQGNSWQIETSNLLEYRKSLLQMANTHNLNIVALQATSQSLEEVFRKLTQPQPAS